MFLRFLACAVLSLYRSSSGLPLLVKAQTLECSVPFFQPPPFSGLSCSDDYIKGIQARILAHLLSRGLALSGCNSVGSVDLGKASLVALTSVYPTSPQAEVKR